MGNAGREALFPFRFIWLGWGLRFNIHRDEFCVLCFTVGPIGFRWHR